MPLPATQRVSRQTAERFLGFLEQARGNRRRAAELAGVQQRRAYQILRAIKLELPELEPRLEAANALRLNAITEHFPPPAGFAVHGVSTLHDAEGNVRAQWVKSRVEEKDRLDALLAAIAVSLEGKVLPPVPPPPTEGLSANLCTVYPQGDPHLGLYAWGPESGADFDLDIASSLLVSAVQRLVASSPASKRAIVISLGDFFHADNTENRTLRSGHVLDVDTRWSKVLRVGVTVLRRQIDAALAKHETVEVVIAIGNHDDHSSQFLAIALGLLYEQNPRVIVHQSPSKFWYGTHGRNLFGVTHSDTVKPEKLGEVMAADVPALWGASSHRYWFTGHDHQKRIHELPGCLVEGFRTLAARDAWSNGAGYRSGRDMYAIIFDAELGEIERHRVDIGALTARVGA